MKPWPFLLGLVLLAGCTMSSKLSVDKAKQLLYADLLQGPLGSALHPAQASLEVEQTEEGLSAAASGGIRVEAVQPTYRSLGTSQLPDNRTVTLVTPVMKIGDHREIPVIAQFVRSEKGWALAGRPEYNVNASLFGLPLERYPGAVDVSTEKGRKLQSLIDTYNRAVEQVNSSNSRLKRLEAMYKEAVLSHGAVFGYDEVLQNLFPDEENLQSRLANAGAPRFLYVPAELRWRARKSILDPIFKKNIEATTTARDSAQQVIDSATADLRTY